MVALVVLVGDAVAILNIIASGRSAGQKAAWIVIVLVLPVVGLVAWIFLGPRDRVSGRDGPLEP